MPPLVVRADPPRASWSGWRLELRCACGRGAAIPVSWLVRDEAGGEFRLLAGAMD